MKSTLLIVDDDTIVRLLLEAHFTSRGFSCILAEDGVAALEVFKNEKIDVLITDLEMPRMDGIKLLNAVRSQGLFTRCIVVTGFASISNLTECIREGAVALVPKPLNDLSTLDKAVDAAAAQTWQWIQQMAAIIKTGPSESLAAKAPKK